MFALLLSHVHVPGDEVPTQHVATVMSLCQKPLAVGTSDRTELIFAIESAIILYVLYFLNKCDMMHLIAEMRRA